MKQTLNVTIFKLFSTLLIILPLIIISVDYCIEKFKVRQSGFCEVSYNEVSKPCVDNSQNKVIPYSQRKWKKIIVAEVLIICGFVLKLILRRKFY